MGYVISITNSTFWFKTRE